MRPSYNSDMPYPYLEIGTSHTRARIHTSCAGYAALATKTNIAKNRYLEKRNASKSNPSLILVVADDEQFMHANTV